MRNKRAKMIYGHIARDIEWKSRQETYEFTLVIVLNGKGRVNEPEISKGDHFMLTSACEETHFEGELELIVSWTDEIS